MRRSCFRNRRYHIILIANNIGNGDEVIVPNLTAYPTAVGVLNSGAMPLPSEIYDNNGLINVEKLRV